MMAVCPNCGNDDTLLPVWEEEQTEYDDQPRYLACTSCHHLSEVRLLRTEDDESPGQAKLTDHELSRLPVGNQHRGTSLTPVEWMSVKGAAIYYGVTDWTSKVDSTLTKDENVSLMEQHGTKNSETPIRERKTTAHERQATISESN